MLKDRFHIRFLTKSAQIHRHLARKQHTTTL